MLLLTSVISETIWILGYTAKEYDQLIKLLMSYRKETTVKSFNQVVLHLFPSSIVRNILQNILTIQQLSSNLIVIVPQLLLTVKHI